jgi:hypothetical protein
VGPENVPLVLERHESARSFAALGAVLAFWGRSSAIRTSESHEAVLAGDLERSARAAGLSAVSFHGTIDDVVYELSAGRPVIVGVARSDGAEPPHYEVVVGWDPVGRRLRSLDPARGFIERTSAGFQDEWQVARRLTLVVFESEPATGMLSSSD